ncbi:3-deoxy-manno-octulosonate cytidylyltransferase [Desulfatiferula olefinivorans]
MKLYGIIPARMASTRFPGKPMKPILGMPMIGHVYCRSRLSRLLDDVYVATCDQVIFDYIVSIGGKAVMTSADHERCTDRSAEAMTAIEKELGHAMDIVVMIQGDEPMIRPEMIDEAVTPMLDDASILVANLVGSLKNETEHEDPNEVKVVMDNHMNAMYFSREPIPSRKKYQGVIPMGKQVCVIPFRRDFLLRYTTMAPTPLEIIESIDMLRILEHGYKVRMVPTRYEVYSVDTAQDHARVEDLMHVDPLVVRYMA